MTAFNSEWKYEKLAAVVRFTQTTQNSVIRVVVLQRTATKCTYILLTKREGRTGRVSARGLDSTDRAQRGPYKKDRGPIFSQYGPEQAWLIRDLLYD